MRDPGEPGLAGWQIHLFVAGNPSFHQQTTTDANGAYAFPGLAPGTYTVCESILVGWVQTAPGTGADCSNLAGVSGVGYALTITEGQTLSGNDFGNQEVAPPAVAVPTLSEWGMLAMALLLIGVAYTRLRRRPPAIL